MYSVWFSTTTEYSTMYHNLPRDASFWRFFFRSTKISPRVPGRRRAPAAGGCTGPTIPRKPRGGPDDLPEEYGCRLSFCCDRDGCRKRMTPPSVRFLGRKVYLGAVVVLVAAMRQGPSPRRVRELSKLSAPIGGPSLDGGSSGDEHFPQTPFWKVARGRLVPAVEIADLPRSLLEAFVRSDDDREGWRRLLRFLSPITIAGGLEIKVSR